jgi:hypothetical protein
MTDRPTPRLLTLLALTAVTALLAGCGDDARDTASSSSTAAPTTTAPPLDGWRCHPAAAGDPCLTADLRTTRLDADLTATVEDAPPATDPAADCFYAPPATSDEAEAMEWVRIEAARFRTVCRVFVPHYVSGSYDELLDGFDRFLAGEGLDPAGPTDRPFLLLGHGEGAALLTRLVQERIQADPALRGRLLSAMLIGGPAIQVPAGSLAGATFSDLPLCTDRDQVGCIVTFSAYEAGTTPSLDNAYYGGLTAGNEAACTSPSGLDGSKGQLRASTFPIDSPLVPPPVINGVPVGDTPFVTLSEYYVAQCLSFGNGVTYLWVDRTIDPTDVRTPGVLTDPVQAEQHLGVPQHDLTLTLGDLLFLADRQIAAHPAGG